MKFFQAHEFQNGENVFGGPILTNRYIYSGFCTDEPRSKITGRINPKCFLRITHVTSFEELPINAQNYLKKIEEIVGVKVSIFSVGPDRTQTVYLEEI